MNLFNSILNTAMSVVTGLIDEIANSSKRDQSDQQFLEKMNQSRIQSIRNAGKGDEQRREQAYAEIKRNTGGDERTA